MRTLRVLFVVLFAFSSPIVSAQAGGASPGAGAPAASSGVTMTLVATVTAIVAAVLAAGSSNETVTAPSHH